MSFLALAVGLACTAFFLLGFSIFDFSFDESVGVSNINGVFVRILEIAEQTLILALLFLAAWSAFLFALDLVRSTKNNGAPKFSKNALLLAGSVFAVVFLVGFVHALLDASHWGGYCFGFDCNALSELKQLAFDFFFVFLGLIAAKLLFNAAFNLKPRQHATPEILTEKFFLKMVAALVVAFLVLAAFMLIQTELENRVRADFEKEFTKIVCPDGQIVYDVTDCPYLVAQPAPALKATFDKCVLLDPIYDGYSRACVYFKVVNEGSVSTRVPASLFFSASNGHEIHSITLKKSFTEGEELVNEYDGPLFFCVRTIFNGGSPEGDSVFLYPIFLAYTESTVPLYYKEDPPQKVFSEKALVLFEAPFSSLNCVPAT